MKRFSFKFFLFFLVLYFGAAATVQAAQRMSARTLQAPKTVQYIQVKPEFKNLTIAPMTVDSVVDELAGIVVLCAVPNSEAVKRLPLSSQKMLSSMVMLLKAGRTDEAIKLWQRVITNLKSTTEPVSINELIYWVSNQAFLENETELRFYASRVKFHNGQKKIIRSALNNNRRLLKSCRSAKRCSSATLADIQKETKSLESTLQKARNQQQASLLSLEKRIRNSRLTQQMSMMSNMANRAHQAAKTIIQNLR